MVLKNPTIEQTISADEVRYYQQDKGVLVQEPSEDAGTLSDYKTARQRIEENVSAIDKEFSELSMLQVNEFLKGKIEGLGFVVEDLETQAGELSKLVVGTGANKKIIRPGDTPLEVKRKLLIAAGATLKEANDMLKGQKNPSSGMGFPETKDTIREPLPIS